MNAARPPIPLVAWVALGSALGACARWGLGTALAAVAPGGFPWAILVANVLGSTLIGAYAALSAPEGRLAPSPAQREFVMAGFCGGFTTFSLFSGELLASVLRGEHGMAGAILGVSVPAWLLGVWAGYAAGASFNRLSIREEIR